MVSLSRTLLMACALVSGPVTGATAADFRFPPEPVVAVPSAIPVPDYNTWYLRGDVGFSFNEEPDLSQAGVPFFGVDLDDSWSIGGGFGYNFRDNIRGDVTVDHRFEADLVGTNASTAAVSRTSLVSTVVLANLYYDFSDWNNFTPYLGGGVGLSYNEIDVQTGTTIADKSVSLAAAAMAGLSYHFGNEWMLDAGYRFLYLGDAKTKSTATASSLNIDDIYSHELRVGFRYELN
jgi:opacity protein-like surface antigen